MKTTPAVHQPGQILFPVTAGDINIYHARLLADQQITYVLEFAERLDLERLHSSLCILHDTLPLLSCTLSVKGSRFKRVSIPKYQPSIFVIPDVSDPEQAIQRFVSTPCNPEAETPLKLLVLRAPDGDVLCFKTDHLLCDAEGLKYLLSRLAEAYTQGNIIQPINTNRGFGQVFRRCSPLALLHSLWGRALPKPGSPIFSGPFDTTSTFLEHACLEADHFRRIHACARQAGATMNDVLLTALYRAIWERLEPAEGTVETSYPLMVPVDMRRYLSAQQHGAIANLSSALYPSLARRPGESFAETLRRVKALMDTLKHEHPGLGAFLLMSLGSLQGGKLLRKRYRLAAAGGSRFINCTNFGVIAAHGCTFGNLRPARVYGVGPLQYAPGFLIAVSTYQETLHLVVQGSDAKRFQPFMRAFLQSIVAQMSAGF